MLTVASWPLAGKRVDEALPAVFERATLPPRNPRSTSVGWRAAALAMRSTSLRTGEDFPFVNWMSMETRTLDRDKRNSFQRSLFSSGLPSRFFHLSFFQ